MGRIPRRPQFFCAVKNRSLLVALLLCGSLVVSAQAEEPVAVSFSRSIRPLLAEKCLSCHGADAAQRQGGLRLDDPASALQAADSGNQAIVPGSPDKSELIARITSTDESIMMPPPEAKKPLTPEERTLLTDWIRAGAPYESHWAFITPERPQVPEVPGKAQPENPIDRFVLHRLAQEQLSPASQADPVTLIRRLTLDLTGLPPTPEEVDAYLADTRPDRYEQAIERLLASPHYGERWGRYWLDAARYADSDGYEKDKPRFVWPYRDWVVNAFNQDMPYDQFVTEQLAGDLLPNPTPQQLVATGFLRNSMINEEGGVDPEQFRMEAMFDRMDALGKSILGLTVQCCQCHDHKYDPISQQEYYQLFAFLNDTHEASVPYYPPEAERVRRQGLAAITALESQMQRECPDWEQQARHWLAAGRESDPDWHFVVPKQEVSGGQKHLVLNDGSILAQGYAPTRSESVFEVETPVESVQSVRLELLTHRDLPLNGPGRALDGTCALTEMKIEIGPADGSSPMKTVTIAAAYADINPPQAPLAAQYDDRTKRERITGPIEFAIDQKDETAWTINQGPGRSNRSRQAVFVLKAPQSFAGGTRLKLHLVQRHGGWNSDDNQTNNLGRYRFSVSGETCDGSTLRPHCLQSLPESLTAPLTSAQRALLFREWSSQAPQFAKQNEQLATLWHKQPEPVTQFSLADRTEHRPTFILSKGNFLQPLEQVSPGVPAVLPALNVEHPTRLDLAHWLMDRRHPTVARSMVNRVWQMYFGTGLVSTPEDFGLQSAPPSHPELLDWLAVEFMESGWKFKSLHRLILTSHTYRQSACFSPELLERDPDNRLLARASRFRMEAEGVRDIALAASGLLQTQVGGPPVSPPCPEFLFLPPASYGPKTWNLSTGPEQYRRALYTFRFRSIPYPALQVFDAPVGDVACVRRVQSNTPLQALAALNEPVFMDCARALADIALQTPERSDSDRLRLVFRRCTARLPNANELAVLTKFVHTQRERMARGELDADSIVHPNGPLAAADSAISNSATSNPSEAASAEAGARAEAGAGIEVRAGTKDVSGAIDSQEQAVWTLTCRALLNLDETITRD